MSHRFDEGVTALRARCGMKSFKEGRVPCLKCGESFNSPDVSTIRICEACKKGDGYLKSGEYLGFIPAPAVAMAAVDKALDKLDKLNETKKKSLKRSFSRKK